MNRPLTTLLWALALLSLGLGCASLFRALDAETHAPSTGQAIDLPTVLREAEAAYDRGAFLDALVGWHRAQHAIADPDSGLAEQVRANISFVERELDLVIEREAAPPLESARRTLDRLSPLWWCWLAAAALVAGWIGLRCRKTRLIGASSLAVGVMLLLHVTDRALTRSASHAVVTGNAVLLHTEPHQSFRGTRTLRPGTPVEVLAASDRWSRVRLGETEAWIPSSGLTPVD